MVLFFTLGSIYPRYWLFFFLYSFLELLNPEIGNLMNNYNRNVQLYEYTKSNDVQNIGEIRQMVYKELGLTKLLQTKLDVTSANHLVEEDHSFNILTFLFATLYEWSWYASDFLYWLIYFSAFISAQSTNDKSLTHNPLIASSASIRKCNIFEFLSDAILSFMKIFDELGIYFVKNLKRTPIWGLLETIDRSLTGIKCYSCLKLIVNFTSIFRILGFVCIFGGLSKFYINFSWLLRCIGELIRIEDEFKAKNSNLLI